jgi:dephospho-CoA kinase
MIKVGLTGGIGSGKTLISEIFKRLSIPVFNADQEAKIILNSNPEVISEIKSNFGEDIYTQDEINRSQLAKIIFNDYSALKKINAIIHPKVRQYFYDWIKKQNAKYVIEEAAILFESKAYKEMNITINVHADESLRIQRVMDRDEVGLDEVKSRMKNQLSDQERINLADYTIYNDGKEMVLPQILEIHHKILNS